MSLLINLAFRFKYFPLNRKHLFPNLKCTKALMATKSESRNQPLTFQGRIDHYNGLTVYSHKETCENSTFETKIDESLKKWREENRRAIWFRVALEQSDWVPHLAKRGFRNHHAQDNYVMMYLWLPTEENCNIPPYAHTFIGVGAVVVNDKSEILVVNEKYFRVSHWKLPGGYVDPQENLVDAAIREVYEETGITTEFQSVLVLRQGHYGLFGCSDLYTVISLKPLSNEIKMCEREIAECKWMPIQEYLASEDIHELNKFFLEKYLEYKEKGIKIDWKHGIHQLLQKPYTVYSVNSKI